MEMNDKELGLADFDNDDEELDWYYEDLLDYIREKTANQESINDLMDQDILYLFELWDEYMDKIEGDDEVVEIDVDDLYQFVQTTAEEDEEDISISEEDLVTLLELQQEFDDSLDDGEYDN